MASRKYAFSLLIIYEEKKKKTYNFSAATVWEQRKMEESKEQGLHKEKVAKEKRERCQAKCHKFMAFWDWADIPYVQENRKKWQGLCDSETENYNWEVRKLWEEMIADQYK